MDIDDLIARAQRLEMKTRSLARSRYAGLYQSAFRGQGMEFSEVRPYSEGDDIRLIDWNVSARSQTLHVKRMIEERERNVLVVLDTSGSLGFGSVRRSKFELAAELASVLVLAAFFARDRVSLASFSSKMDLFIPAAKGWTHAARLIREIAALKPGGRAQSLEAAWNFLNSPGIPRSLAFILTDYQAPLVSGNPLSIASRKHELVFFLLSDPREWTLPESGCIRVSDPETGQSRLIHTGKASLRREFEKAAAGHRTSMLEMLCSRSIDSVEFSTGADYESQLRRFLQSRAAKRGYRHQ
jgi:uncharacterized protein (DUF58 family)